jgi:hypothetical protein
MKNTGKLHLHSGETYSFNASVMTVYTNNFKLDELSRENGRLLILIGHSKLQTLIDVSGIEHHLLLGFDAHKKFIGTTYCNTQGDNNFIVSLQARFALLIDINDIQFDVSDINKLETNFFIQN